MKEQSEAVQALARAGRRVVYHLLQAAVEGLKAVEAVIEELGNIGENDGNKAEATRTRIEIE
ncbi:MAG: hypothetical protein WD895_04135 [Acidimicrobiia bacterium]